MKVNIGVFVGRFQPIHNGHVSLILDALTKCEKLIIVIGNSFEERSARNPFTEAERIDMILKCFTKEQKQQLILFPLKNLNDIAKWKSAIMSYVDTQKILETDTVGIFGFNKDESSYYLDVFTEYKKMVIDVPYCNCVNSTEIRTAYFKNGYIDSTYLDENVVDYLDHFRDLHSDLFELNHFSY